jgi:hypothetical protein
MRRRLPWRSPRAVVKFAALEGSPIAQARSRSAACTASNTERAFGARAEAERPTADC